MCMSNLYVDYRMWRIRDVNSEMSRMFGMSTLGILIDVLEDVWFVRNGVVLVLAGWGDVADQSELLGDCNGCTRKCSCTKLKSCLC